MKDCGGQARGRLDISHNVAQFKLRHLPSTLSYLVEDSALSSSLMIIVDLSRLSNVGILRNKQTRATPGPESDSRERKAIITECLFTAQT